MNFNTMERNRGAEHLPQALGGDALVLAAQTGDEGAFTEVWIRHSEMVLGVLMRVTKNREDAEDALQEAFLKAFAHLGTFESRTNFNLVDPDSGQLRPYDLAQATQPSHRIDRFTVRWRDLETMGRGGSNTRHRGFLPAG